MPIVSLKLNQSLPYEIILLQGQVEQSVREFKDNYQENTFTPHITIARIRNIYGKIDVLPFLKSVYFISFPSINNMTPYFFI